MLKNKSGQLVENALIVLGILIVAFIMFEALMYFIYSGDIQINQECPVFCRMRRQAIEGGDSFWDAMFSWDTLRLDKGGPFYSYVKYKADKYDKRDEIKPKEANCWCGVQDKGRFLHVRIDYDDRPIIVYDYHITTQKPMEHNNLVVSGNVDHESDAKVPEKWNYTGYDGCLIFSVDESYDKAALYGVKAGTIVNNTLKNSMWGYLDDRTKPDGGTTILNVSNPEAGKGPLNINFGFQDIKVAENVGEGQYKLLNLSLGLALKHTLKCKNVTGFEGHPNWKVL